jgi:hypothetical protein
VTIYYNKPRTKCVSLLKFIPLSLEASYPLFCSAQPKAPYTLTSVKNLKVLIVHEEPISLGALRHNFSSYTVELATATQFCELISSKRITALNIIFIHSNIALESLKIPQQLFFLSFEPLLFLLTDSIQQDYLSLVHHSGYAHVFSSSKLVKFGFKITLAHFWQTHAKKIMNKQLKTMHALILDDDALTGTLLSHVLTHARVEVIYLKEVDHAYPLLKEQPQQMILINPSIPKAKELCIFLSHHPVYQFVPMIGLGKSVPHFSSARVLKKPIVLQEVQKLLEELKI